MENYNWEKTGMLEGLTGNTRETVIKLFKEIDFKSIPEIKDSVGVDTLICPVIRRIVSVITPDNLLVQNSIIKDHSREITEEDVLPLIDVKEITELLIEYVRVFIPYAEKYLPDLDAQAEMCLLFCDNYVMKLIGRTGKWK
ncbi:MAG: hypothetical protein WC428_01215 [Candidatus Paceibacterota bacterium]